MKSLFIAFFVILFVSCNSDDDGPDTKDYTAENEKEITDYIKLNNLDATRSSSGLYYVIDTPGTGNQPTANANVRVAYKGYFTNGSIFDQSDVNGITFNLSQVISGWTEGIQYFKEGGSGVLLVPSALAYGNSGRPGIPGGSVLIFDVNLKEVN